MSDWQTLSVRERDTLVNETFTPTCSACGKQWPNCAEITPSTNIKDAQAVEDVIERRELIEPYTDTLARICGIAMNSTQLRPGESWALIRATPEQRCLAALRTVGVEV